MASVERLQGLIAAGWRNVMPADPGRVRLYSALRATLTGVLAWVVILGVREVLPIPTVAMFLGISSALSAAAFLRDTAVRAQCITLAGSAVAGFAGLLVGMSTLSSNFLGQAAMVCLIFLTVYAAEFGPRWPVLGLTALSGFIFALLVHPQLDGIERWAVALGLGALSGCAVRLLLTEHPADVLARLDRDIRASIARILSRIDLVIQAGAWRPADRQFVRREIDLLNQATILAEATAASPQVAAHGPATALHFFAVELVTERVARQAQAAVPPLGERAALHAGITDVKRVLRGGSSAVVLPPGQSPLAGVLANLVTVLTMRADDAPAPDIVASAAAGATKHGWSSPMLQHALQASLASAIAIAGGDLVSPRRWYWAAMTAYVLFQGIRSRVDSLAKAVQALVGTLAGALAGLLIGDALAGHEAGLIIAIFAGVFLAYQAAQAAYAMMTFWLTVCLALMFSLLGAFSIEVLLTRLLEAVVGAVSGISIAWLFLGTSAAAVARKAGRDLLAALLAVVQAASDAAVSARPEPSLAGLAVTLHSRIGDLLTITRPRIYGLATLGDPDLRRQVVALTFCANWGRELALSATHAASAPTPEVAEVVRASATRIAASVAVLSRLLASEASVGVHPEAPLAAPVALPSLPPVARLLVRIDAALAQIVRRALGEL